MENNSLIEKVIVHPPHENEHIARIRGEEFVPKSWYYRNKATNAEYAYLAGGIGLPGTHTAGGAMVVAVDRNLESGPTMRVMQVAEHNRLHDLFNACLGLRDKYGFNECADLFWAWYGDEERLFPLRNDFNNSLDDLHGIYPVPPSDWDKKDRFQIYMQRIRDLGSSGHLLFDSSVYLENQIRAVEPGDVDETLPDKYPTLVALGYVVHSLLMSAPWEKTLQPESNIQTIEDELFGAMNDDYFDFGGLDEYDDDGSLINTVGND